MNKMKRGPENVPGEKLETEFYINKERVFTRDELLVNYPEQLKTSTYQYWMEQNQPRFYAVGNKYYYLKTSVDRLLALAGNK
ncbi:hypothetical protein MTX78_09200 [Hymenobacter tibetensis]|uniref:Uncharacterized protein n=1 Tax=Hymenobacter tibetensis TaxID=497967 RepID=A0ABY4D2J3_9BACT|nr:hypothetical protein [Hymenobacter tibetensis]UOG76761.1 hypothetical protein MTX78_09200 [Hymenobacter tibetensis]